METSKLHILIETAAGLQSRCILVLECHETFIHSFVHSFNKHTTVLFYYDFHYPNNNEF